jgi:mRNA interferase MazF
MSKRANLIQGDIWWVDLPLPAGRRPALILTRTAALTHLTNVTVAPLTRTRRSVASEVALTPADGVPTDCVVSLENILTVPQHLVQRRITALLSPKMDEVFHAIHFVFALPF